MLKACAHTALRFRPVELAAAFCSAAGMADTCGSRIRIYTRTGDRGSSSLFSGERLPKDAEFFHALGDVDELNSALGVAAEFCQLGHASTAAQLAVVQSRLLDVGSAVATPVPSASAAKLQRVAFDAAATKQLEEWIDDMDAGLPPLKNFILPSGGKAAVFLHLARAVCRRAERSVVPLTRNEQVDAQVAIYLNRLSDYLFTAARHTAKREGQEETIYKKGA